jgi:PAS domain S-box-containing protein
MPGDTSPTDRTPRESHWISDHGRRLERITELVTKSGNLTGTLESIILELSSALSAGLCSAFLADLATGRLTVSVGSGLAPAFESAVGDWLPRVAGDGVLIVDDTAMDSRWSPLLPVSEAAGVRAAWSVPIISSSAQILGRLISYYRAPYHPEKDEIDLARIYAAIAASAVTNAQLTAKYEEGRAELESIIEQMPEGVFIARAPDGVPLVMNRIGSGVLGNPPGGITLSEYANYVTLKHPDGTDVPASERPIARALRGESARDREFTTITRDGKRRHLLLNYAPLRQASGAIFAGIVIFRDISDQKQAEEAVRRSEERYRTLIEQASVGIFTTDDRGAYVDANTAGCTILGYSREEILKLGFGDVVWPEDRPVLAAAFKQVLLGSTSQTELRMKRKDGALLRADISARLLPESRVLVITRDITERKRAEEELQRQDALLRGVASATSLLLTVADHNAAVAMALARLGSAAGAHRAYIYEAQNSVDRARYVRRHYWQLAEERMEAAPAQPPAELVLDEAGSLVRRGETIHGRVADLAEKDRQLFVVRGARSVLIVPISIDNGFWGFIGFEDSQVERLWSENEVSILKAAAATIGAAIGRTRAAEALRASEQRFSIAFNESPLPMSILTLRGGRYLDVNDAFLRISQYRCDEVIGRTAEELKIWNDPADRATVMKLLRESGSVRDLEVTFRLKQGTRIGLFSAELIDIGGEKCVLTITNDITERKSTEDELRASEERFSKAFNASPMSMGIIALKSGRWVAANDSWLAESGFSREDVIGRTPDELGLWADPSERRRLFDLLRESGSARDLEVKYRTRAGQIRTSLLSAEIIDVSGEKCVLAITKDITEQKQRESELVNARREWQSTFDAMTDNVLLAGADDCLIRANRAFYERIGLSPEECIGKPVAGIVHRSRPQEADACPICHLRRRGERAALELPAGPSNNFPLFASIDPIVDASGKVVAVVQVVRNLSDLYRAREEAERERTSLIATIEQMAEGLIVCNEKGAVIHANRHAQEIFGFSLDQMRGDLSATLPRGRFYDVEGNLCDVDALPVQVALSHQIVVDSRRLWYDCPDGRRLLISVTTSPFFSEQGKLAGAVALVRDITEQHREHERLQQADKLRALGQLASGVAHNFNNALASVIGYTQLGLRKVKDPEVEKYLAVIEQSAQDAARMVERIQNFSRRSSRADDFVPLPIADIVRDAIELTRARWCYDAEALGIKYDVSISLDEIKNATVKGEPSELREVFINIILNALDAMPNGGVLAVTAVIAGPDVVVSLTDSGAGMTEEIKRRVFEPFFTTKGVAGLGMGMSESYRIIERHGGRIDIDSQLNLGSTFTVLLPVAAAAEPVARLPEPRPLATKSRVLVLDDEEYVRKVLAAMLREMGHEVTEAATADEAAVIFASNEFDIAFTDLAMPKVDGIAAAVAMKSLQPGVRIVLMTGYGADRAIERAGETDAISTAISKPFSFSEIQEVMRQVGSMRG